MDEGAHIAGYALPVSWCEVPLASGGPKVECCIPWDVDNRILYRAPHIATVTADTADAAPPGMRRIRDLSVGDRLIEDDGTIVEVTSALDTFGGQFRVVVIGASGMRGYSPLATLQGQRLRRAGAPVVGRVTPAHIGTYALPGTCQRGVVLAGNRAVGQTVRFLTIGASARNSEGLLVHRQTGR